MLTCAVMSKLKLHSDFDFIPRLKNSIYLTLQRLPLEMASKATWIAFGSIARRGLTTSTPTRYCPHQRLNFLPPHHTLASKATKGRKIPKNHFTSTRPALSEHHKDDNHGPGSSKKQEKGPKRKAAARSQAGSTSLKRVAVEAERSRGSLIKGKGRLKHIDPEAETKDVTAYCAAETYNVHIARDLLRKEGWVADPCHTHLFPHVLHVQTQPHFRSDGVDEEGGDVFVFPSGSVVTWNVSEKLAHHLVEKVLVPASHNSHLDNMEAEDLEYVEDPTRDTSQVYGDTILLGTAPPSEPSVSTETTETDTVLAKIAFSSALARSTKLAVLENSLSSYFKSTQHLPQHLSKPRSMLTRHFTRAFILRKTGELLDLRAQLNLYSELTDSLPDIFWDSPHELGLENYFDSLSKELDVGQRIRILNEKMDYASELASVFRDSMGEKHSHLLEWIIIVLIAVEIGFNCWHTYTEVEEWREPMSNYNLQRLFLLKELELKEKREKR